VSEIANPASPGYPIQVVAQSVVRAPLAGNIPWTTPGAPAVGSIPITFATQVVTVPHSLVDRVGGAQNRR
jgi:hypothetical protein